MKKGCIFSYLISEDKLTIPELAEEKKFGKYTVLTDSRTSFSFASEGFIECAVFGLAVNVMSGNGDNISVEIVEQCKSIHDVIEYEKYLGGKYIILYRNGEQYYFQGDATCSKPCFYNTEGSLVCSNNLQYIVHAKKISEDNEYHSIRQCGDISQAMPYDITSYREIKQLIPNHYLDMNNQKSVRFINAKTKQNVLTVDKAIEVTSPMIDNILDFYLRNYKIYCPITSGRDSRVVLSFLMHSKSDFCCYTIKHPEHNDSTQDIIIPIDLCKRQNIPHVLVEDTTLTDETVYEVDNSLGEKCYSKRTLRIAQTVLENFGDGAIINGDIIGQVGKCSLHRDIPTIFATPSYFRCKLHNYSSGAKKYLKLWLRDIDKAGEQINHFDLFSIENRMGRWAAQSNMVYDTIGQMSLNIFNSRSIIYTWTAVERKMRKRSAIHLKLINDKFPALLDVSFESDNSVLLKFSKSTWLCFLCASYIKFYFEKMKYGRTHC